jgi:hypothetical protein
VWLLRYAATFSGDLTFICVNWSLLYLCTHVQALLFLHLALERHPPAALRAHIPQLVPAVTACVGEEGYKVIAEALRYAF